LQDFFSSNKKALTGKKALVTAGPTYENLDPVRFIGNYSSGKMGVAIAKALAKQGCEVELLLGPSSLQVNEVNIHVKRVVSAKQMFDASIACFSDMDIAIMSAAVADYTPVTFSDEKIKKKDAEFSIALTKTKDILKHLGTLKTENQLLIGFALENHNEQEYALKKLSEKNADAIILNSLNDNGAGFAHDTNKVTLFEKDGKVTAFPLMSKEELATQLVDKIIQMNA
jgi:phosphopantothenoylcysteine decarboxylase/phosphopantothenate--cysteine ligase